MAKHVLTDRHIRNAKPASKPYRLFDGDGLALLVSPSGSKSWQLRYRLNNKGQTATLGKLERLTLAAARAKADELRGVAASGQHLTTYKRRQRLTVAASDAATFKVVAAAWVAREAKRKKWTADYKREVENSVRNHLSDLDAIPVGDIIARITTPLLTAVARKSPAMEPKVAYRLDAIMDHAVRVGIIDRNPLPKLESIKSTGKNFPAVVDLASIGKILRDARASDPCKGIQRAHHLLVYTAQRISEVINARWDEFDLDAGLWEIPRERMKRKDENRGPHIIPLPTGLLSALKQWRRDDGSDALFVCPAPRDPKRAITDAAVEKHYRVALKLKDKHSPHSWRSAFSTVSNEAGRERVLIEAQLDHVIGSKVENDYDRSKRIEPRRELMTWYEAVLCVALDRTT